MSTACCPLCWGSDSQLWFQDQHRSYWRCGHCQLVWVPERFHLTPPQEKAIYDLHQNDPADPGYCRFLNRVVEPVVQRVGAAAQGLDFGCGPGPALPLLLGAAGLSVALYDKFYFPDAAVLQRRYDFITATEVVEHLSDPQAVFQQLYDLLQPGGWLAIMTKRVRDLAAFSRWHYIQDPTHICFFSDSSFAWIAERWGMGLTCCGADVMMLQKT